VAFNVVRLVNVRLDEGDALDPRVAANHVQHRHPAAAGADLEHVSQDSLWIDELMIVNFRLQI
jgi:hypothetical protein